jgi:capsular exopolysaccharide synthesis family protein
LVLAVLLVPAAAWVALGQIATPYTATGIMLYDPAGAAPPGDLPPDLGALVSNSVVASQAAIIDSLPAARELTVRLHLAGDPEFDPAARRHIWTGWWPLHPKPIDPDAVASRVRAALAVSVPPSSNVLTVSFTSRDPALSAAAVNLAMQLYLGQERDQAFANVTAGETWLAGHETALETQLDATEAALSQARAAAGIVSGEQVSITTEAASRLAGSLVDAKAQLAMAQARLQAVGAGSAGADAADAQIAPNMLPLRTEQADLSSQIGALAGQYGDAYPPLAADRAQLAAINSALADETARELASARADVAADAAQVASLTSALAAARAESQTQDADTAPIRALEQRETAQKAMLQNMDLQADQLAQQAALTKTDSRILSAAAPPPVDTGPRNGEILAAACLLGLCLGLLLVQLAEHLDSSFSAGGTLRAATGLACLALVPEVRQPLVAPLVAPLSLFAEQLRGLRTALTADGLHRVIAITAARPSEGKTTLTIALARALAASGVSVLAIDGDVRQPSFDAVFETAGALGLTDILSGLATSDDVTLQDGAGTLRVLAAGTQTRDALSLFLSPALPALLAQLRAQYDVVLLDVPPAFALAEARILARLADATLLCVRWGKTPSRVVLAAITLLREAQVNLVGAALTRVNARRHKNSGFPDAEMYQPRYGGYFRS